MYNFLEKDFNEKLENTVFPLLQKIIITLSMKKIISNHFCSSKLMQHTGLGNKLGRISAGVRSLSNLYRNRLVQNVANLFPTGFCTEKKNERKALKNISGLPESELGYCLGALNNTPLMRNRMETLWQQQV